MRRSAGLAQARKQRLLVFRLLLERSRVLGRGHVLAAQRIEAADVPFEAVEARRRGFFPAVPRVDSRVNCAAEEVGV